MKNIWNKAVGATSLIGLLSLGSISVAGYAEPVSPDQELINFINSDPTDVAAIDVMSMSLIGEHYWVKLPNYSRELTGTEAAVLLASAIPQRTPRAALPSDTFSITVGRATVTNGFYVTGTVIFKSTYAGQAPPLDYSSLQFNIPSCMVLSGHTINTSSGTGGSTNLGYLSNANLANDAPIWKIQDQVSGFNNLAHRSAASVLLSKSACAGTNTVQAAYLYEHNQSGIVSSTSATFGFLTLNYSSTPMKLQKSSSVMTWTW